MAMAKRRPVLETCWVKEDLINIPGTGYGPVGSNHITIEGMRLVTQGTISSGVTQTNYGSTFCGNVMFGCERKTATAFVVFSIPTETVEFDRIRYLINMNKSYSWTKENLPACFKGVCVEEVVNVKGDKEE